MFSPIPFLYRLCLLIVSMGECYPRGSDKWLRFGLHSFFFILDTSVWDRSDMGCGLPGFLSRVLSLHYVSFAFFISFFSLFLSCTCLFVLWGFSHSVWLVAFFVAPRLQYPLILKFIYFALCYQLVIIDLIKTATICGQIVPNNLSCFILASVSLWDNFFEQSSRKGSFFLKTCID